MHHHQMIVQLSLSLHHSLQVYLLASGSTERRYFTGHTHTSVGTCRHYINGGVHITKHGSALYIVMAKILPIIDVLGYDGQNS